MNDTNNKPNVALTPDQLKARAAALAAAQGEAKPAETAPTAVADTSKPAGAVDTTPKAETPTSDAPTGTVTAKPAVLPDLTKPVDKPAVDDGHKAAIAKANASTGKPPQGGKPNGKPAAKASGTVAAKPAGKPASTVAVAKPQKLGKSATALANDQFVCGYDLARWPAALERIKPTATVILAVRSTGVLKMYPTKNELALCVYAMPEARTVNVYDVATALQLVLGGSHDHKMNTVNQKAVPSGMWLRLPDTRVPGVNGGKALIAYGVAPTAKGLKLITAALEAHKLKVPKRWLPDTGKAGGKVAAGQVPVNA